MNNPDLINSPNTSNSTIIDKSKITIREKIIIGILLIILILLIVTIGQIVKQNATQDSSLYENIVAGGISRDSTLIPFLGFKSIIYTIGPDGAKKNIGALPENLGDEPEWSPDGQWVASSSQERFGEGTKFNIYIMRADGSQRVLIPIPHDGLQPTWSPDGKQIAYSGWAGGVYIINVECLLRAESCSPESRLIVEHGDYPSSSPDWSPDGRQIVYAGTKHISIVNVQGQSQAMDLTPYLPGKSYQPSWSPDGSRVVGLCNKETEPNFYERVSNICMIDKNTGNFIYLTNDTTSSATNIDYPIWFPDGQKIAYLSSFSVPPMTGDCWEACPIANAIFTVNIDGSNKTKLFSEDNFAINWLTWYP